MDTIRYKVDNMELISYPLHADKRQSDRPGVYADGPFKDKPIVHPYQTILRRLSRMGINPLDRLFGESDRAYVERMDRIYTGQFEDILASGILDDKQDVMAGR